MVVKVLKRLAITSAVVLAGAAVAVAGAAPASAVSNADFNPGYVISDAIFYNSSSMSQAQVQSFLVAQELSCPATNGLPCLRDYVQTTYSRAATTGGQCSAYTGATNELASQIIFKVAQACGINPQVLLVTLQKEQSLVTASSPTAKAYQSATGYYCPDSSVCNAKYYGFYNQVYSAAWQYKQYSIGTFNYHVGLNSIAYSQTVPCGSSQVNILNQATANLYDYTPYQPNNAALSYVSGPVPACASFGNLNFWRYFNNWFGSSTGRINPYGVVDSAVGVPGGIYVQGWAIDPDTVDPIPVHVYIDGIGTAISANQARSDVGAVYPSAGPNHGYSATIPVSTGGTHQVCIYGINIGLGANQLLGSCRNVVTQSGAPYGVIDALTSGNGQIVASGWAIDPDTAAPLTVAMTVDGVSVATTAASGTRNDVAAAYPGYGSSHGYSISAAEPPGGHQVCLVVTNVGAGVDTTLPCRSIVVPGTTIPPNNVTSMPDLGRAPFGVVDAVTTTSSSVTVAGWAIDPDTADPIRVHVYLDANGVNIPADGSRADVAAAYPGYGPNHEYAVTVAATPGTHDLCVYAINNSTKGPSNTQLTCRPVSVP